MHRGTIVGATHRAISSVVHGTARGRWRTCAPLITAAGLLAGCAAGPAHTGGQPATGSAPVSPRVQVLVHNDNPSDVVVYVVRSDMHLRIGEVVAHTTGLVTVPPGMAEPGHVALMVHQISGGDFYVDAVPINAEDEHAELHVLRALDETSLAVVPGRMH